MAGDDNSKYKVYVGLSGGVDSSVSAALLKTQGYDVTGVFIKVWQPDFIEPARTGSGGCTWKEDRRDAMRVCAELNIPFLTLDLADVYKREVADYMVREYAAGRTPNPDVMCNQHVKFGAFLNFALAQGADYIATGHYAQNILNPDKNVYRLWAGADYNKDQTYFLWTLGQRELSHTLFPVGHLQKDAVRQLAREFKLPTATKADSQGLCFLGMLEMSDFLQNMNLPQKVGSVVTSTGECIGEHRGAYLYTLGQRHGFSVTSSASGKPHYVVAKDIVSNTVTVSSEIYTPTQSENIVTLEQTNWISQQLPQARRTYYARTRYRQELVPCFIKACVGGRATVTFTGEIPIVPSGQSFVAYEKRESGLLCIGGGVIA